MDAGPAVQYARDFREVDVHRLLSTSFEVDPYSVLYFRRESIYEVRTPSLALHCHNQNIASSVIIIITIIIISYFDHR